MLRESIKHSGGDFDLKGAIGEGAGDGDIEGAGILGDYAEAVTLGEAAGIAGAGRVVADKFGPAALVDAAAVAAAFHGFVRVADGTGIPGDGHMGGKAEDIRDELGIDDYFAAADR